MPRLLHIRSSANLKSSVSRQLGDELVQQLIAQQANLDIVVRDLAVEPPPHINPEFIEKVYGDAPDDPALALSNQRTEELLGADVLVIESAMYNYGITSTLKAWLDHVVRAGLTFDYSSGRPQGLVHDKRAYIIVSRGGDYSPAARKALDFQEPYLRAVLNFIGITDVEVIHAEGTNLGEGAAARALQHARGEMQALIS